MSYLQLIRSEPRPLIFGICNGFFSGLGQTHFVALFSPFLISFFAVNNTQYGIIYSLATLLSAFVLPMAGPHIDRMDVRIFALWVGIGLIVSELLLVAANGIVMGFVALFGLRLFGQGLCTHLNSVPIARYFSQARGKALGIVIIGQPLAEGLLTPIAAYGLTLLNWQHFSLLLALAVAGIYLPIMLLLTKNNQRFNDPRAAALPVPHQSSASSPKKSWTRKEVFSHSTAYFLIPQSIIPAFTLTGVLFHQGIIAELKGWTLVEMASGLTFYALGRTIMGPVSGPIVDRLTAYRLYPYYLLPLAGGFIILANTTNLILAYVSFALFGISVGLGGTIKTAIWPELYGTAHLGAISSTLGTITVFSTAVSPALFGYILDVQQGAQLLVFGCAALTILASIIAWFHMRFGAATNLHPDPPHTA